MKKISMILQGLLLVTSGSAFAADGLGERACNLQGREVALRISEELAGAISVPERTRMAEIAEAVCRDYMTTTGMGPGFDAGSRPVFSQPAPQSAVSSTGTASPQAGSGAEPQDADEDGLFGDIRIIEPEDRVRRPGLKRR